MLRGLDFKCHFCPICDGNGCIGELPGMGGVFENANFLSNTSSWKKYADNTSIEINSENFPKIRLAPITGAIENIGYHDEKAFYFDMINAACQANILLSIGDGCPDEKIQYGIEAVKSISSSYPEKKAAVFIKPYPNDKIIQRIEWASEITEIVGIDIDSYNIITMRNKVHLEKKDATKIKELRKATNHPFAIKGVFTQEDVDLVKQVKPEIVVVSNHGGRIETERGSTADFLYNFAKELSSNCKELWVDGGIRCKEDVIVAAKLGAKQVMIGRPFISALCRGGLQEVQTEAQKFCL